MRLLLIEDVPDMAELIVQALQAQGWEIDHAGDAETGMAMAASQPYDVLIVDRMLPKLDGLTALRRLRSLNVSTPALIVSAKGADTDKVDGLEGGADDYLAKPFSINELVARIKALHRRVHQVAHPEVILIDDLEIWLKAKVAVRQGRNLGLTETEFKLLRYLSDNRDNLVTRRMILENVFGWRADADPDTSVVEVSISRLRGKVDKGFDQALITTVRGKGYCLAAAGVEAGTGAGGR
jgi:two-component system OmpR family response regulator